MVAFKVAPLAPSMQEEQEATARLQQHKFTPSISDNF